LAEAFYGKACALSLLRRDRAVARSCLQTAINLHQPHDARAMADAQLTWLRDSD
jgi:hypothetical protein